MKTFDEPPRWYQKMLRSLIALIFLPCLSLIFVACGRHQLRPEEIERNRIFARILELEDRRSLGHDDLLRTQLESSPYPEVRRWCAIALGRIGDDRSLTWLCRAFESRHAAVRAAAAFAVGEIEDRELLRRDFRPAGPHSLEGLRGLFDDPALEVRMRAVEALGKAGEPADAVRIARWIEALPRNSSPEVRTCLDLGITALMRLKVPDTLPVLRNLAERESPDIQWRAANALVRMRDKAARQLFLRLLNSPHADVQAYAASGIGICEDPGLAEVLLPLLPQRDPHSGRSIPLPVRYHAVHALGALKSVSSIGAIEAALRATEIGEDNPDQVNFAAAAASALGNIGAREGEAALNYLLQFPGPAANGAVIALGKILSSEPARFFGEVSASQFTEPPAIRAWTQALGELGGPQAIGQLKATLARSAEDHATSAEMLAAPTALTALAKAQAPDLPDMLRIYLASHDGVLLRAALDAYKPDPKWRLPWAPIVGAYMGIAPANEVETKVSLLSRLEPWVGETEVQGALRAALGDRLRDVRATASKMLRKAGVEGVPLYPGDAETRLSQNTYHLLAGARKNRTITVIETNRGNIEIDLFHEDAPITASNFIELAKGNFFDGQSFMRVVPFFVVQGGDPRNDQEGGPGYSIRCEINMRPFERGSVGMALAGKDTGGSQFFICLSPQPHLDGAYTCFGRVISGMQVVEHLVPGDRIRKIRIEEDITALDYCRY